MGRMVVWWGGLALAVVWTPANALASRQSMLDEAARQAVQAAVSTTQPTPRVGRVAVCPIWDDADGYVRDQIKAALTRAGFPVFSREDEVWSQLLAEIEWGVKREDVMSPATIQKFGRIQGVDTVLYGTVRERTASLWDLRAVVRLTLHMAKVETGENLWSSREAMGEAWATWVDVVEMGWPYGLIVLAVLVGLTILIRFRVRRGRPFQPV